MTTENKKQDRATVTTIEKSMHYLAMSPSQVTISATKSVDLKKCFCIVCPMSVELLSNDTVALTKDFSLLKSGTGLLTTDMLLINLASDDILKLDFSKYLYTDKEKAREVIREIKNAYVPGTWIDGLDVVRADKVLTKSYIWATNAKGKLAMASIVCVTADSAEFTVTRKELIKRTRLVLAESVKSLKKTERLAVKERENHLKLAERIKEWR